MPILLQLSRQIILRSLAMWDMEWVGIPSRTSPVPQAPHPIPFLAATGDHTANVLTTPSPKEMKTDQVCLSALLPNAGM